MSIAIQINSRSATPKYRQIANSIMQSIERKIIRTEEQLPSINELSTVYNISRDTAEKAYRLLKNKGMIKSVRGKGYFAISNNSVASDRRILLVFNKLSPYKEAIYNSFVQTVNQSAWVDLQVYYNDLTRFERILREKVGSFTDYVIIPSFKGETAIRAQALVDEIMTGQNLMIINHDLEGVRTPYGAVVQNFEADIYQTLRGIHYKLSKYNRIKLYFPFECNYSRGIIRGFQRYCLEEKMDAQIVFKNYEMDPLEAGTAYIVIKDDQLVTLVNKVKSNGLTPGKEVGIIAYNDSPLKQVLLDGISVMSADHHQMGQQAAQMIMSREWRTLETDFRFIERGSL